MLNVELAFKILSSSEQACWKYGYSQSEAIDTLKRHINNLEAENKYLRDTLQILRGDENGDT